MTEHFIILYCPNCGTKLDVYDDMDGFFCGQCGSKIAVQRRGGTVVLTSPSNKVQVGPDRAAELDLVRLKEEAQKLSQRREAMLTESAHGKKWGYLAGMALVLIGYSLVRFGLGFVMGLGFLLAGFITISAIRRNSKKALGDVRQLDAKIQVLNDRIEDRQKLAAR